jgi:hypothetical protein
MTKVNELVVPLENKPGTLGEATRLLAGANVNVLGIDLDVVGAFGIARFLVTDVNKAEQALKAKGFKFRTSEVLTVRLPNKPGALAEAAEKLGRSGVNIEGVFGYTPANSNEGELIFKVDDIAQAQKVLGV